MAYWLKIGFCAAFLLLVGANAAGGNLAIYFGTPWNGLLRLIMAFANLASPLVFIYLLILAFPRTEG